MKTKTGSQVSLSDEQWALLFRECRTSGLSIKDWCELHQIKYHRFYYHRRRLQEHACEITTGGIPVPERTQEIVDISPDILPSIFKEVSETGPVPEVGVRLTCHGITLEIMNSAASECIRHTVLALRELC